MSDKRKALGDGSFKEEADFWGPGENRLSGPYPGDSHNDPKPETNYTGAKNPAMCDSRPIADMSPDHGSGDIDEGVAFRVPL